MSATILFVHGAFDAQRVWGEFPRLIKKEKDFKGFESVFLSHDSTPPTGFFASLLGSSSGVTLESIGNDIVRRLEEISKKSDEIYIVAHSLGGVAFRKALGNLDDEILGKIRKIIYFDTPDSAKELESISTIFGSAEAEEISVNGADVDRAYAQMLEYMKKMEAETLYISAIYGRDAEDESKADIYEFYELMSYRHPECCRADNPGHQAFVICRRFITGIEEKSAVEVVKSAEKEKDKK